MAMKRGAFLAASAALVLGPRTAHAQAPLRAVTVASAPDADAAACLYAQEAGLFRKAGLDVALMPENSGSAVAAAVFGGAVEIGKSSLTTLITAYAKGIPVVLIAPSARYNPDAPVTGTLVRADSPLKRARELSGKIVGVQSLRGALQLATMKWVDDDGGDSASIKFLELPPSAGLIALAAGRVDAITLANPFLMQAVTEQNARVLGWSSGSIGKHILLTAYFTTRPFASANPAIVRSFARAMAQSAAYLNAHGSETTALVARFTGASPEAVAKMPRELLATTLDARDIQPYIDVSVAYKFIPERIDAETMIVR